MLLTSPVYSLPQGQFFLGSSVQRVSMVSTRLLISSSCFLSMKEEGGQGGKLWGLVWLSTCKLCRHSLHLSS